MSKTVCVKYCAAPFCVTACPSGALTATKDAIIVDSKKCHACGLCRVMCMTYSRDHALRNRTGAWLAGKVGAGAG